MQVRVAIPSDAPFVATVQVDAWRAAYRGLMPERVLEALDAAAKVASWEGFIASENDGVFAAELGAHLIGFVHVCPSRDADADAVGEVGSMYVAPAYWRQRVGTALLREAERWCLSRGFSAVTLWVLEANGAARGFYERFGYSPDGASKRPPKSGLLEVRYRRSPVGR